MEVTINKSRFQYTDYLHAHSNTKINSGSVMNPFRAKRNKQILRFNKWFQKEHDYCLPIKKQNAVSLKIP